jgi:hypothetical protein
LRAPVRHTAFSGCFRPYYVAARSGSGPRHLALI